MTTPETAPATPRSVQVLTSALAGRRRLLLLALAGLVAVSITRAVSGQDVLTNTGTARALLALSLPIALAGLGGLVCERAGVVNIGLEGMMILGTWGAGWAGYQWGAWGALAGALIGGALGGLLHAVATVTFGVDHIISGVAINLLAAGAARFLSELLYRGVPGGGPTQSPTVRGGVATFDVPVLVAGPDLLGRLERTRLVVLADAAGLLRGLLLDVSVFEVIGVALFPAAGFVLWRTAAGLRLRSAGENPWAAESLGVNVIRMKYVAVVSSGALAGLGGLFLVLFSGLYKEGQSGGRGYIGLAAMIFGNWRPGGLLSGAVLFGYTDAIRLRSQDSLAVLALFLLASIVVLGLGCWWVYRGRRVAGAVFVGLAVALFLGYAGLDSLPNEVTTVTPYIVTLLVLAVSSQNLRPPAADGLAYRRGEDH
jgi:general nucleoside transport system permease protein